MAGNYSASLPLHGIPGHKGNRRPRTDDGDLRDEPILCHELDYAGARCHRLAVAVALA
jgi:hypothetical protein